MNEIDAIHDYVYFCTACNQIIDATGEDVKNNPSIVTIDTDIAPAIIGLNRKGWKTVACCQGGVLDEGGELVYLAPYIKFDPSVIVPSTELDPLPSSWYYEDPATQLTRIKLDLLDSDNPEYSLYMQLSQCQNVGLYISAEFAGEYTAARYKYHCHMAVAAITRWVTTRRNLITDPINPDIIFK